jgi:outer membrane protein TolC
MQSEEKMRVPLIAVLSAIALLATAVFPAHAEAELNATDLVEIAIESNPQIRAVHAQWQAAQHQILQNYAPADPIFTYANLDSDRNFDAAEHSHAIAMSFQFPGEALLQADQSKRTAEIARLTYEAAVRDLRAGVETAYYQVLLDEGLITVNGENIANLKQVVHVTQAQYMGGQAQQSDLIGAELALDQAQLQQRQYQINRLNDRAGLNQLLFRKPAAPLELNQKIELTPLEIRLDKAVEVATHARQ